MRSVIFIIIAVSCFGCSRSAPDSESLPQNDNTPRLELPAPGTSFYNEKKFKAGWSIALWNEAKNELVIGFLEAEPPADKLEKIIANKDLYEGVLLGVPLVQFSVAFAETDGMIDVASPTHWTIMFAKEYANPWTFYDQPEDVLVEISGDPRSGGQVKGRFAGTYVMFANDTTGWNFSFELPVR